jgi:hypothetical protein
MLVNIGTNKKNIVNYKINKRFDKITYQDIVSIIGRLHPELNDYRIHGWAEVKKDKTK